MTRVRAHSKVAHDISINLCVCRIAYHHMQKFIDFKRKYNCDYAGFYQPLNVMGKINME